jgi:protein-L-isoaspartate(D-aspartate) O-methyltransferase
MSNPDFPTSRRAMIDSQLRTSGIAKNWIIAAMASTPRETFVPAALRSIAYMDRGIDIGGNRRLNPPVATAMMLDAADVRDDDHVLLVGAGTGYLATLLAGQAKDIVAVEEDSELFAAARAHLAATGNVKLIHGPLSQGAAGDGPYSLIIIDGGVEEIPAMLTDQLADGGRIVCGLSDNKVSRLASGYRRGHDGTERHSSPVALRPFADTEIAPLPGFAHKAEFVF